MLVNLKNTGLSTRIFHDIKGKQHIARVGQEIAIEIHDAIAKRFERGQAKGDPLEIEYVDGRPELGQDVKDQPPGMSSPQQTAALQNATDPKTRSDIEGKVPAHAVLAEEIPPERTHDPITANATQQGKEPEAEQVKPADPATPAEVIAAIEAGDISEADQLRLARAVLPNNTLPQRPKPAQIMAALKRAVRS
jgi:hypothetical protein